MKRIVKRVSAIVLCVGLLLGVFDGIAYSKLSNVVVVKAAAPTVMAKSGFKTFSTLAMTDGDTSSNILKVGKKVFYVKEAGSKNGTIKYNILLKKAGKKVTVIKDVAGNFATNGSVLYYIKIGKKLGRIVDKTTAYKYMKTVWRIDLTSKKKKKLFSSEEYHLLKIKDNYMYGGFLEHGNFYAYNLKTHKRKNMGENIGEIQCTYGKILTQTHIWAYDNGNYPIYIYNKDGSGKKKIADAIDAEMKNNKIYYILWREVENKYEYQLNSCTLTGKNKKVLTEWSSSALSIYDIPIKSSSYVMGSETIKIGKDQYKIKKYGDESYKIMLIHNNKSKCIAKNTSYSIATNGEIMYYFKQGKKVKINEYEDGYEMTLCKKNLVTGKESELISDKNLEILGVNGKYLYIGTVQAAVGVKLYSYNVETGDRVYMRGEVGDIQCSAGKVLVITNLGDIGNAPIHIFNKDGTGKVKIGNGCSAKIIKKKVYFIQIRFKNEQTQYKVYRTNLNGKNKKAITKWSPKEPKKYNMLYR